MKNPLVSIIIPVYNGSDYMREAIDSALSQTYENIEIIVINDGSSDGGETDRIARSYGDKIRYIHKENGGVSSALNVGIREMNGEYFSWLSHDDVYSSDKVEKQVEVIKQFDKNTIVGCGHNMINEDSQFLSGNKSELLFSPFKLHSSEEVLKGLLEKRTLNGCVLLIPKEIFEKSGCFDESLRFCQDRIMWYNVFLGGHTLYFTDDKLVCTRIHKNQLTQTGQALFRKECSIVCEALTNSFVKASDENYNFLKLYLFSDSKYLSLEKVKEIIRVGKENNLLSFKDIIKGYMLWSYGKIRPFLRKAYYLLFRKIVTK